MKYQVQTQTLEVFTDSLREKPRPVLLLEGSREVREADQPLLVRLGALLAERMPQAVFRSGNAEGSDSFFAEGVRGVDPARMQLVTPTAGHRRKNVFPGYEVHSLDGISTLRERDLAESTSLASPANRGLIDKRQAHPRLGAKAKYLLRDTLKVLGDPENGLAPADAGLFYTKPDPMSGGTGHTIRVCQQANVPVILFVHWRLWL